MDDFLVPRSSRVSRCRLPQAALIFARTNNFTVKDGDLANGPGRDPGGEAGEACEVTDLFPPVSCTKPIISL